MCDIFGFFSLYFQGNFVASMTAILRQMEDYHYAHLIKTLGKMRTDVVVSLTWNIVPFLYYFLKKYYMINNYKVEKTFSDKLMTRHENQWYTLLFVFQNKKNCVIILTLNDDC